MCLLLDKITNNNNIVIKAAAAADTTCKKTKIPRGDLARLFFSCSSKPKGEKSPHVLYIASCISVFVSRTFRLSHYVWLTSFFHQTKKPCLFLHLRSNSAFNALYMARLAGVELWELYQWLEHTFLFRNVREAYSSNMAIFMSHFLHCSYVFFWCQYLYCFQCISTGRKFNDPTAFSSFFIAMHICISRVISKSFLLIKLVDYSIWAGVMNICHAGFFYCHPQKGDWRSKWYELTDCCRLLSVSNCVLSTLASFVRARNDSHFFIAVSVSAAASTYFI